MLRLAAAGIRRDVGETLVELKRYKCSAFCHQSSFAGCVTTKNPACKAPVQGRMRVRTTHMIGDDADIHISLVTDVSRCQPAGRFETEFESPLGRHVV